MKSIEFLTEAEANIAQKKLDKYLDMLSNDNLRVLIPMLKSEVQMDEAVNPELYQRLAARKGQGSPIKVDNPKPVNKQPSSTTKTTADPEAAKVQQVISSLSADEKKELLSLLQKEAKTRPAAKKPAKKQDSGDKKSTGKGMMGCLLPLVGIIGLLALIPDSPNNATEPAAGASQDSASDISDEQRGKSYAWDVTRDIKSKMRDPDSAKFKEVQTLKGTTYMVVGYVKGKNAFGGYSDWTRFISASTDNANITMIEEDDPAEFAKAWNNLVVGSSVVWSDSSDYTQFIK